ncbi:coiled-coil domain-containing protein 150 [Spea bombifrons]|uniref:coiled-coil domain-containing protein 150 n=1 Tax=Spea bombifrons TaxID=233779 RepID=UPI0023499E26|nr:coiled-coil domain-containing protein 150 [Spea bombifrons]
MMARPVISPLAIEATAPETFSVLQQRMRVAEEQAESLISDLQALGMKSRGLDHECHESSDVLRPISPVKARPAFGGDGDTLWRNCENLVNRMCRMESIMQTLKLGVFRLHTERKLNPKQSDEMEQHLSEVQEEHARELREAQLEVMRLRQRLNNEIEERESAEEAKERLSAALEIATATKTDVAIAAEKMKEAKFHMKQRVAVLQEKLSREAALRGLLEEEQADMLRRVEDMKQVVDQERAQVQELQQCCQTMRREGQELKSKLQEEELRRRQLEEDNLKLQTELQARDLVIGQLQDEAKNIQSTHGAEQAEFAQVRTDLVTLQEAAEKVQSLNQQLEGQCSELTTAVQRLTAENSRLLTQHQQALKALKDTMEQKLQEQELLHSATQAGLTEELQRLQSLRTQLERDLESLRAEHTECQKKAIHAKQKFAVQKEVQDSTIARLRGDLDLALREKAALESVKASMEEEMFKAQGDFQEKIQNLEIELTENKLELGSVQCTLLAQEKENRRLMECVALLEQEKQAHCQVEVLLAELMESKNKLAYEKGKLQSTIEQLKSELQTVCDAKTENSQLRKLNAALESKHAQLNTELGSCRIHLQMTQSKLHQAQTLLLHKEEDLLMAVKARDEALNEEKRLAELIEVAEEKDDQNKTAMQKQLCEVREERNRLSSTLENIVSSHTQLQRDLEKLQTELGRRDSDICALRRERDHNQKVIKKLEAELSEREMQLQSAHSHKHAQVESLRRAVEVARGDNKKLAHALEQTLHQNSSLKDHAAKLENELKSKEVQEHELQIIRTQAEEDIRVQELQCSERIASLKKQHQTEYKEFKKGARKELAEVKKALDIATLKSAELSRANRELRANLSEQEKTVLHQKSVILGLKTQLKARLESKATNRQTEKLQELEAELKHMEQVKEDYEKHNKEQSEHIAKFMAEVSDLRRAIAAASQNTHENVLRSQLEEESQLREQLEERYKELQKRVRELQQEKEAAKLKLREASEESEQISISLEEAHNWFQTHFDVLLLESPNTQKSKRQSSVTRAQEAFSRENYTEYPRDLPNSTVNRLETKQKLKLISRNYRSKEATSLSLEPESGKQS